MARILIPGRKYEDSTKKEEMIPSESSDNLSKSTKENETMKTNIIVVNKLTVTITELQEQNITIGIEADIEPILNGKNTIKICFEDADEPINFNEDELRLHKIISVIQKQAYSQYPHLFKTEDPDVIISNYSLEVRKDSDNFPNFKDAILDSLYSVYHIEV